MRGLSAALLWGGTALALIASGQSWWTAGSSSVSGTSATSGASLALALAGLAGAFLSRFLRTVARRVVSGLVAALFAGGVIVALTVATPTTLTGSSLADAVISATPWRWIYLTGMGLAVLGALMGLFVKPSGSRPAATPDPALDTWKSLDAGVDPTERAESGAGGEAPPERQQ